MRQVIHSLRKRTRSVILDGERQHLPLLLPIGSTTQDPDSPQREANQVRAFHRAVESFDHFNEVQHQAKTVGEQRPVLAVYRDRLVLVPWGFITEPDDDLTVVGTVTKDGRRWIGRRT